ncbi:MAG: 3'(2'),5'-bisphosphate nucleotidase CysQ [Alphaproteobacteria bacterium]|nr:3'(2'),5'-bisphosphate nucleotidase CysQ [Alphaproteobacteria bacterium]MDE2500508.1 3'(2'),5'-bisphosphate nucleotidase CysQ [Alphaproteobacteria bacterium]
MREAGVIARKFAAGSAKRWSKTDGSPVTEADLAIDRLLNERLCGARPDYGWLSEETEDDPARLAAKRVFVVDPIDGTLAFVKGKPHFTICAAVVEDGLPIAAAVYNPLTEECFVAAKGSGTRLNGAPAHVNNRDTLDGCRMLASKATLQSTCWGGQPWPPMTVETPNSIAYRIALVACGAFDAAITLSATHDWDLAAADLIVTEAGGMISSLDGKPLRYNQTAPVQPAVVAAGPALHAVLLSRASRTGKT